VNRREQLARFRADHPVRHVDADGVTWSYVVGGAGPSTILYLPGGIGQAEAAFTYLLALEAEHRVVAVSYPEVPSMAAVVDGLLAVLDAEGIGAVHVWGTSFGGMVAQCLVRRAPDRVLTLVLSNTAAPAPDRVRRQRRQARLISVLPQAVVRPLARAAFERQLGELSADDRAFWREYLNESLLAHAKRSIAALSALGADFYAADFAAADLGGWPGRVLILQAEDDELYASMHEPMRRLYPDATVRTFAGGHAASLARQDEYLAAVREFLT
jgi:pimeloyl-ACP methyl ester carboxylesterase